MKLSPGIREMIAKDFISRLSSRWKPGPKILKAVVKKWAHCSTESDVWSLVSSLEDVNAVDRRDRKNDDGQWIAEYKLP